MKRNIIQHIVSTKIKTFISSDFEKKAENFIYHSIQMLWYCYDLIENIG